jgi:hypothetical protein
MVHHTGLTTEHIGISFTGLIVVFITINTFMKKRKGLKKVLKKV